MFLSELFERAVSACRARGIGFAVAGGLAADLYRAEPRTTMDVDLAIVADESEQQARQLLERLGFGATVAWKADLAGGSLFAIKAKKTPACVVVGRIQGKAAEGGVDILLPALPWVSAAVERAQFNLIDFGFGPVPVLTLEDLILSKLYALTALPVRPKDMDDLQSIDDVGHRIDAAYVGGKAKEYGIKLPRTVKPFVPERYWELVK